MNSATATINEEWVSELKDWDEPGERYAPLSGTVATSAVKKSRFVPEPIITEKSISRLRKLYEFRGGLIVERFLRENSFLNMLLLEAYEEIRKHFHGGTRTALEVVADPEAQEDQQLFVVIRTSFSPKVARALLSELDHDWWLDALPEAEGRMEISLERIAGTM